MTSTALAERPNGSAIALPTTYQDDFVILDPRSATGVAPVEEQPRINQIATISAGKRGPNGNPMRSQKGEFFVHGNAPGLEAVAAKSENTRLTVMFSSDNPRDFIHQHFVEYSASAILAFGDEKQITVFRPVQGSNDRKRIVLDAGTKEYEAARARCKNAISVYFSLAEWTKDGADMIFPDGLGQYRLRFTSLHSLRSILSSLHHMANTTKGRIAGIPFDMFINIEERTDGTGAKRRVPIWQLRMAPPSGVRLTAHHVRAFIDYGQRQREMLQLCAPSSAETAELIEADAAMDDLDEEAIEAAADGGYCDKEHYNKLWHASVAGTRLAADDDRHQFLAAHTKGKFDSLAIFLQTATTTQAQALVEKALDVIAIEKTSTEDEDEPLTELEQKIVDYNALCEEARDLGIKTKPLPDGCSLGKATSWYEAVEAAVEKARDAAIAAADAERAAEAEESPIEEDDDESPLSDNEPVEDAPGGESEIIEGDVVETDADALAALSPIAQAQVAVGNRAAPKAKKTSQAAALDAAVAPAAAKTMDVPTHLKNMLGEVKAVGQDESTFLDSPAMLTGINAVLARKGRDPVATARDLSAPLATLVASAIVTNTFPWPDGAGE